MRLPVEKIEWTRKVLPDCADNRFGGTTMLAIRVLLVDDDEVVRMTLTGVVEQSGFAITSAANVPEGFKIICGKESYDMMLSDLHMPGAGGWVHRCERHAARQSRCGDTAANRVPEMTIVAAAILQQTNEILAKPVNVTSLVDVIKQRVASGPQQKRVIESVASTLERGTTSTIRAWHARRPIAQSARRGDRWSTGSLTFRRWAILVTQLVG
jgi:CheY-like chemotaxis protein